MLAKAKAASNTRPNLRIIILRKMGKKIVITATESDIALSE
jgi:hypothetical protein